MRNVTITWRGAFTDPEFIRVHDAAFGLDRPVDKNWAYRNAVEAFSLGWVTARIDAELVGFANVPWDGGAHAWLQDVVVTPARQRQGIGQKLVGLAAEQARKAGCEWLHVDFDDDAAAFYFQSCGFTPTNAGLLAL